MGGDPAVGSSPSWLVTSATIAESAVEAQVIQIYLRLLSDDMDGSFVSMRGHSDHYRAAFWAQRCLVCQGGF